MQVVLVRFVDQPDIALIAGDVPPDVEIGWSALPALSR